MFTFLLVILVLDSIVLITAILMQAGKGGGLAASFGGSASSSDSFMGTRQMGNALTRTTWWAGGIFLALGLVLSIMSSRAATPRSIFEQEPAPIPTAPGTPAIPLEPAPAAPTAPTP
jgi:preprotein translocase subunit SecG